MPHPNNRGARAFVQRKEAFRTRHGSIFAFDRVKYPDPKDPEPPPAVGLYIVFSYRQDFPLFMWDAETDQWFGNISHYSPTTSKHWGLCHPLVDIVIPLTLSQSLILCDERSYAGYAAWVLRFGDPENDVDPNPHYVPPT